MAIHIAKPACLALLLACIGSATGCTSVSLGNPETSTAEPALLGWWKTIAQDDSRACLIFRAYDKRTLLVNLYASVKLDPAQPGSPKPFHMVAKSWITWMKNGPVLCVETMDPTSDLKDEATRAKRFAYFRYTLKDDSLTIVPMAEGAIDNVHTSQELANAIDAKWDDRRFWAAAIAFKRTKPGPVPEFP
jgi:hypothetical protein